MFACVSACGTPCERNGRSYVAVVVDASDPLEAGQIEEIWLGTERGLVPGSGPALKDMLDKSSIRVFWVAGGASRGGGPAVVLEKYSCEASVITDNPRYRKRRRVEQIAGIERAVREAVSGCGSEGSPIIQVMNDAARWLSEFPGNERNLIVASDLMQNVVLDFYRQVPDCEAVWADPKYRGLRSRHLKGVKVELLRLPPRHLQKVDELESFWKCWIEKQEGRVVSSVWIGGSPPGPERGCPGAP